MRRYPNTPPAAAGAASSSPPAPTRSDIATLKTLLPYLWVYKWRVLLALACLVGAKLANVGVPVVMKKLIDSLSITPSHPQALLVLPVAALVAYGVLRVSTTSIFVLKRASRSAAPAQ